MEKREKVELVIEQLEERIAPGVVVEHPNAGRGNGSEGSPDIDPGNSGAHNQGGD
ncbi:hypothetical protein [Nitrospira sp. Nam74]